MMRQRMEQGHVEVPTGVLVTAIISIAATVVGWIIRLAAREALSSFKSTMAQHGQIIQEHAKVLTSIQAQLAAIQAQLDAQQRDITRLQEDER